MTSSAAKTCAADVRRDKAAPRSRRILLVGAASPALRQVRLRAELLVLGRRELEFRALIFAFPWH